MKKLITILLLSLLSANTVFGYTEKKPETLDTNFTENNDTFIKSNNSKYGYKIKTWLDNNSPVSTLYVKNFETREVYELYQTETPRVTLESLEAFWTKDDILVFTAPYDPSTSEYLPTLKSYNPVTDVVADIDQYNYVYYLEEHDLFIYNKGSFVWSYDPHTEVISQYSHEKYTKYSSEYDANKQYSIYIDDVKLKDEVPLETLNGSLYVPLSFAENNLGCNVEFSDPIITITKDENLATLSLNSNMYQLNYNEYTSKFQPTLINGQPYISLRFLCNTLDYSFGYLEIDGASSIDTTKGQVTANLFIGLRG